MIQNLINNFKIIINQLLTGKDNTTHDLGRYSWLVSIISVIGCGIYNLINHLTFDIQTFANALSTVVAAHAGALWAKKDTEPNKE